MRAWYFATEERKLRYGDNRSIVVGETHTVDPEKLKLCAYGLHASTRLIDALRYAPGSILYEVELSGKILDGKDKVCASERTYLREIDCTEIIKEFTRKQALISIDKIKVYCIEIDYNIILQWLNTGDSNIKEAARAAASSVVKSASSAAKSASSAARSASSAARSAWAAAWAARLAALSAESAESTELAGWSVVWSAAWLAIWPVWAVESVASVANSMLEELVNAHNN